MRRRLQCTPPRCLIYGNVSTSNTISAFALVISIVALVFTGLQEKDSHNQLLLSMKPSVDFEKDFDPDDNPVGISVGNEGPGPAVIKSVTYFVDKKAVGDVDKLVEFQELGDVVTYDFDEGDTLAVGQRHWLLSLATKVRGNDEKQELDEFVDLINHHLAVEVKFCTVLPGDCYTKCSTKGWCR